MATQPRAGSYLNLEKVRVSKDHKTGKVHLTCKDPDIPKGLHLTLNEGTQAEQKLSTLLETHSLKDNPTPIQSPTYSFLTKPFEGAEHPLDAIRSLFDAPDFLEEGDSLCIPLGFDRNDSEVEWKVEEFPNLFVNGSRGVDIAMEHALHWANQDGSWEVVTNLSSLFEIAKKKAAQLKALGLTHISELTDPSVLPRTLYIYSSTLYNNRGNKLQHSSRYNDIGRNSKLVQERILKSQRISYKQARVHSLDSFSFSDFNESIVVFREFERLGIHLIIDVQPFYAQGDAGFNLVQDNLLKSYGKILLIEEEDEFGLRDYHTKTHHIAKFY